MKKIFLATMGAVMTLATGMAANQSMEMCAQGNTKCKKVSIEKRVERMQQQLMLNDKQATKFADIYTEYLKALENERPKLDAKPGKKGERISDNDMQKMQKDRLEFQKKRAEINAKYYNRLSDVLNVQQLEKVFFQPQLMRKGMCKMPRQGKGFAKGKPGERTVCPDEGSALERR